MAMKVGILTFHYAHNYGAYLQTLAMQRFMEKLGFIVDVVDYRRPEIEGQYKLFPRTTDTEKLLLSKNFFLFLRAIVLALPMSKRRKNFINAIKTHLKLSFEVTEDNLSIMDNYDLLVFGSDQIWSIPVSNGFDKIYWGFFPSEGKKCAYAASAGDDFRYLDDITELKELLSKFDKLSVREKSLSNYLNQKLNMEIPVMPDPTFLLNASDWKKYIYIIPEKYVLVYDMIHSNELHKIANSLADLMHLPIKEVAKEVRLMNRKMIREAGPVDFLSLVANAKFVVTSSFHGTALSVNFHKQFYSVFDEKKSNRIFDLLQACNLDNRYISSVDDITFGDIDFAIADEWVNCRRDEAKHFFDSYIDKD